MIRILFLILTVQLISFSGKTQETHKLTIEISGIKKVKGKVEVCLVKDASEFLNSCSDYNEVRVNAKQHTIVKREVKTGVYAITMMHDANENGKLDTNFFGLPSERYGFSNNPRTTFGPPSYKKCLFEIKSDTIIRIRLK